MRPGFRLRTLGVILTLAAFAAGLGASWAWFASVRAWERHLTQSFVTGFSLFESLRVGTPLPAGITAEPLAGTDAQLADQGEFARLPGVPVPGFVTNVALLGRSRDQISGEAITLGIVSGALRYPVSELALDETLSAGEKFGAVTRLLASYCSEPILFARMGEGQWWRVDGTSVWGCAAAPRDLRLPAAIVALVALAILLTGVGETSAQFNRFARNLRTRRRLGGPESYSADGPEELRDIVEAVNAHLEAERAQLEQRATVLSGVSHDLGTPATRLRLRVALIEDPDLRGKLEADLDRMTGMIESVLTYTRAEMNVEEPRQISLTSFVEALVADYQDTGKPVGLRPTQPRIVEGGGSVFSSKRGHGAVPEERRMLVTARPISLQRALSNLIDNALKYGRRATVELDADADSACIVVEDEGSDMSVAEIEAVLAPFQRGANAEPIDGFGLGLTIAATVAEQHGGELTFEAGPRGLRACMEIRRN